MHAAEVMAAGATAVEVMGAAGVQCMSAAVECIWAAGERISAAGLASVLSAAAAADVTFGTAAGTPTGLGPVGSSLPAAMSGFAAEERRPKARVDRPSFGGPNALELSVAQPA
jgi:hypothetical protein